MSSTSCSPSGSPFVARTTTEISVPPSSPTRQVQALLHWSTQKHPRSRPSWTRTSTALPAPPVLPLAAIFPTQPLSLFPMPLHSRIPTSCSCSSILPTRAAQPAPGTSSPPTFPSSRPARMPPASTAVYCLPVKVPFTTTSLTHVAQTSSVVLSRLPVAYPAVS